MKALPIILIFALIASGCEGRSPEKTLERQIAKLQRQGRNGEGISLFESIGKDLEPTQRTLREVALCYFGENRYAESLKYAKQAIAADPDDATATDLFFYNSKVLQEFEQAESVARRWVSNPNAKGTLRHIAIFYTKWGRYEEAIEATRLGISRLPKDPRMAGTHSFLLAVVEGPESQHEFVEAWSSKNKPNAYFWENVGKGLAEADHHSEALPYLLKALKLAPSGDVASQYVSSLRGAGRSEEAVEWASDWSQKGEIDAAFLKMQGAVNFDVENFDEAARCFKEALDLAPADATLLVNFTVTLIELKRYEEAVDIAKGWLLKYERHADDRTYFYLADSLSWDRQYDEAIEHYATAIRMAPEKRRYVGNLFFAMNQLGQFQEVLDYHKRWKQTSADYSDAHLEKQLTRARSHVAAASGEKAETHTSPAERILQKANSASKKPYSKTNNL
ncbi:hypothetical protein QEH56_13790 [Pelagicoccus enzymogenes]|uniref:tetratricopeptide repeat protein n=1 Tax=Pelagicoccus enzymogenes TaxID=2773457 RepID=UPI00280E16AA|nr:tetratricopeptide repeat protein [Pelagicoccus enzymogenes]MDQ8199236.1 hypothetical protein [Pelagicoccus enzymogenes]